MKTVNFISGSRILAAATISIFLCFGCASNRPILSDAVTPADLKISAKYNESVTIHVENGREFNAMNLPKLSNETLAAAVRNVISTSKLFSEILPSGGRYALNLYIVNVSQPYYAGTEMTVGVEIAWALKDTSKDIMVWRESIQTEKTVTSKDELMRVKLKLATELATKENIKMGVKKISELKL